MVKGGTPEGQAEPGSKPFTVCLELMENVIVRMLGNKKAKMRVYPLILMCRATGTVHAQVACDHSTSAFLVQWDHFVAVHGKPTEVVSDLGGQPTFADNAGKADTLNWEQVQDREAEQGTALEFVPTEQQWRNEPAETRVKVIKATLRYILLKALGGEEPTPSYSKICTVLMMVANVVHKLPVALRFPRQLHPARKDAGSATGTSGCSG